MEEERTQSLLQFLSEEGLVPSPEEELEREIVVNQLKQIVIAWAKKVAWQRGLPKNLVAGTSATILTYGSYGLGVQRSYSDIDVLCVGPSFATMEDDFFIVLRNMLQNRDEVSQIGCVNTAKVPLICFKFNGISVDLAYMRLPFIIISDKVNFFEPYLLANVDNTSLKSFSGVHFNQCILQLIPNVEKFQSVLRCVKLWARKRGIYNNLHGFLGGIHLAILVAYVCCAYPDASISSLFSNLFETFAFWEWPTPVSLVAESECQVGEIHNGSGQMPLLMPFFPYEVCKSYITRHTFMKIRTEIQRAFRLLQSCGKTEDDWRILYEPFPYATKYHRFVKIFLSAADEVMFNNWVGYVRSCFYLLLEKLENVQGFCDPNPTEYVDSSVAEPHKIFYWGLSPSRSSFTDIYSVEVNFMNDIRKAEVDDFEDRRCRLQLTIVKASEFAKNAQLDTRRSKVCWRMSLYSQQEKPVFSQHFPSYFVGYATKAHENA